MDVNPLIRRLEGYAPLSEEDKEAIRSISAEQVCTVACKTDILSDGRATKDVPLILEGWAARYKIMPDGSRQITAFLIPGDLCSLHIRILEKMDHGIMALTSCKIAYLDSDQLDEITTDRAALTEALRWIALVDEAVLRQWIINSRRIATAAISHLFCEMHLRMKAVGLASENRLELPMSQEALADATGMTPVHVNRTLQTLRKAKLIELGHKTLTIPDVPALAAAAGFDDSYLHLRDARNRLERAFAF